MILRTWSISETRNAIFSTMDKLGRAKWDKSRTTDPSHEFQESDIKDFNSNQKGKDSPRLQI